MAQRAGRSGDAVGGDRRGCPGPFGEQRPICQQLSPRQQTLETGDDQHRESQIANQLLFGELRHHPNHSQRRHQPVADENPPQRGMHRKRNQAADGQNSADPHRQAQWTAPPGLAQPGDRQQREGKQRQICRIEHCEPQMPGRQDVPRLDDPLRLNCVNEDQHRHQHREPAPQRGFCPLHRSNQLGSTHGQVIGTSLARLNLGTHCAATRVAKSTPGRISTSQDAYLVPACMPTLS